MNDTVNIVCWISMRSRIEVSKQPPWSMATSTITEPLRDRPSRAPRDRRSASTTYTEPYNLARLFASLDHISGDRAGWNIVTTSSPQAAQNFGCPSIRRITSATTGRGNISLSLRGYDSWEDDALVNDPVSGIFADTSKIHKIDHIGKQRLAAAAGPTCLCSGRLVRGRTCLCRAGALAPPRLG